LKFSANPFDSGEYGVELVTIYALIAVVAVEITTRKLCRVVSMHGIDEAVELALEIDDEIAQRTASIRIIPQ
jgi:hypothetical protein